MGFSKPTKMKFKVFAWAIMKAYKIPYSHVYIKIHSKTLDRDLIYQASKTMVNFMGARIFNAENTTLFEFEIELTDVKYKEMMQWAIDKAGTPYGTKQCVGIAIVKIYSMFGKTIKNPFTSNEQTYICSELAAYILQQFAGEALPEDISNMTPLDVYNYVLSVKDKV